MDFEVDAGEVVALVGDNGAGKSTLIKAIAGIQPGDEGEIRFDGQPVTDHTPAGRRGARDRDRLPGPRAVRQPRRRREPLPRPRDALGRAPGPSTLLDEASMEQQAARAAGDAVGDHAPQRARGGRRRCPAASASRSRSPARCSASRSSCMLDEPTAALGVAQTAQVLELIRRLRERGLGVVVDQPQPGRRLRGRRPHRRAAARPQRAATSRRATTTQRGGRRGDHRRRRRRRAAQTDGREAVDRERRRRRGGRRGGQETSRSSRGRSCARSPRASSARCACCSCSRSSGRSSGPRTTASSPRSTSPT